MLVTPETAAPNTTTKGLPITSAIPDARNASLPIPVKYLEPQACRGPASGRRIHLPHAPRDRPTRPGLVPDLRDGTRAKGDHSRRHSRSRIPRHEAAVLDLGRADAAGFCAGDGRDAASVASFEHSCRSGIRIWVQFVLATPVVLWGGWPFFQRAVASVRNVSPNMFTLIAIGTGRGISAEHRGVVAPQLFPASMRDLHTGLVPAYFESAAVITTLVLLGQVLELRHASQTSSAIKELLRLAPETATVIHDDGTRRGHRPSPRSCRPDASRQSK